MPSALVGLTSPLRTGRASVLSGALMQQQIARAPAVFGYRGRLPALDGHLYVAHAPTTPFQEYFGLLPSREPVQGEPVPLPAERIESRLQRRLNVVTAEAFEFFHQATVEARDVDARTGVGNYPNCADCVQNLSHASRRLIMLRDLDDQNHLPPLLLTHVFLEQDRPLAASGFLIDAFKRNPDLLDDARAIRKYFGDADEHAETSLYLSEQMRRFVRIGELNPKSPPAQLLEAYCAFQLGDTARARRAAERAIDAAQGADEDVGAIITFAERISALP